MRPVDKGECPDEAGVPVLFADYQHARPYLIERLGEYCSYCEMQISSSLHVEHKLPKGVQRYAHLEREWSNFLLACPNCNPTKGHKDINAEDYVWPDTDNTLFAFDYGPGALIGPSSGITDSADRRRVQNTISLVGLDRIAGNVKMASDRRWLNREHTWGVANKSLANLNCNDTPELRDTISELAKARGFYSVWYTVFQHDRDMLERFYKKYSGTCRQCFDTEYRCIEKLSRSAQLSTS